MIVVKEIASSLLFGMIVILGLSIFLSSNAFDYDICCENHGTCDSFICNCSCTILMSFPDPIFLAVNYEVTDRIWQYPSNCKMKDLPFEFYRPPERTSL
jgi:hypothetical protein